MSTRRSIQLLPEHLIDQIKAGEVIERPSVLIKELLENAIDAKATQIDIHLIEAGLELIQIQDNGIGIPFDELPLAFSRHATSKIMRFDDLYSLHSYGFRGEALASIAAVAKLSCSSCPAEHPDRGGLITFEGGIQTSHVPYSAPTQGTSFFIRDLFFNTPARLKFLKSQTSEKNALKKMLQAFVLSHPEIQFSIKWDDKAKKIYPQVAPERWEERLEQVLGERDLFHVSKEYEGHQFEAFFSRTSAKTSASRTQCLFVNGRLFYDKSLHQMILRAAEALWPPGEVGHYLVFLRVPVDHLDVNVHPNKTQIKFYKASLIYSLISGSIKTLVPNSPRAPIEEQTQWLPKPDLREQAQDFIHDPYQEEERKHYSSVLDSLPDQTGPSLIRPLTRRYALYNSSSGPCICAHSSILGDRLYQLFQQLYPIQEEQLTPLLISEPFKVERKKIQPHLKPLLLWGLEFDFLDQETLVLRSLPHELDFLSKRLFIGELLNFLAHRQGHTDALMAEFLQNHLPLDSELPSSVLRDLTNWMAEHEWEYLEKKLLIPLDDATLDVLFPST